MQVNPYGPEITETRRPSLHFSGEGSIRRRPPRFCSRTELIAVASNVQNQGVETSEPF
jgi:hypothetical protein